MTDIVVIGTKKYGNVEWFLSKSFEQLGYSIEILDYDQLVFTYRNKKIHEYFRMVVTRQPLLRDIFITHNQRIIDSIKRKVIEVKPRVVIVVKGHFLPSPVVEWIRKEAGCKVALCAVDDPAFFAPLSKSIAYAYDHVFTGAEKSIAQYKKIGIENVSYLALACYPPIHRQKNFDWENRPYDITFVGTYYPERGTVIKELRDYNLHLWGPMWNMFWIDRKIRNHLHKTEWLSAEDIVDIYNKSKIVINIHAKPQIHSRFKANMKVFEISASCSFQLCDYVEGLEDLYDIGKEIEVYRDTKELREKIDYYLSHPNERRRIAEAAAARTHKEHRYIDRAREIMSRLDQI